TINFQHGSAHGLTGFQGFLRMIDALLRADIAHVDHAFERFVELHERSELGEAGDGSLNDTADWKSLFSLLPRVTKRLFQAERNPALAGADAEYHYLNRITRLDDIGRLPDFLGPGQLRQVNKAFNARLQLDESTEIGDARHGAANPLAALVLVSRGGPGVGVQLLDAERDAASALADAMLLDLENLHFDLFARLKQISGLVYAAPGHIRHVQQAVDSPDIDKRPEIG